MSGRLDAGSILGMIFGWATVLLLLVTAAFGLWLDFVYNPDAAGAWDNIEGLQDEIEFGLFVRDLRPPFSLMALASTSVWFVTVLAARRSLALAVALVFGLSVTAWLTSGDSTSIQRSFFESGAAAVALATVVYSLRTEGDCR